LRIFIISLKIQLIRKQQNYPPSLLRYQRASHRSPRPLLAVVFNHHREVRRLPAVPKLKLDQVLFPLGVEGFAEFFGVRWGRFTGRNNAVPDTVALVRRIVGAARNVGDPYP
jgi:hypothetical protein